MVARAGTRAGLFLVALATLMDEILLTRIFSVIAWYPFACIAISVAMFGMPLGAILIHAGRGFFTEARTRLHLSLAALLFAVSLAACFLIQVRIAFSTDLTPVALLGDTAIFLLSAVPFVFGGVTVCLALTRFPGQVGGLYAADLAGASLACVAVIYCLKVADGPTAILAVAAVAAAGSLCFALEAGEPGRGTARAAVWSVVVLAGIAALSALRLPNQAPLVRLISVKGAVEEPPLYEAWNSFSRIQVRPSPTDTPLGRGLSPSFRPQRPVRQLILDIDAGASTILTEFHGNLEEVRHLRYDVTSLAHYLRRGARVLVIGAGGGRDVLAALAFAQASVVGVEINEEILRAVTQRFGDFTGHLERDPRVLLVNDEARSWIARQTDRFDIIQASFVDTSAVTAAGAFVFTENSVYTIEAWTTFLDHLTPRGLLTFSWFYFSDPPAEMYRLTSLARAALRERGIADVRAHLILVRHKVAARSVGTILVSPEPFTVEDLAEVERVVGAMGFDPVLAPGFTGDPAFTAIAAGAEYLASGDDPPLRIDAPTDDAPFFFNMLRLSDALRPRFALRGSVGGNQRAVVMLGGLLIGVVLLTLACVAAPLRLAARDPSLRGGAPFLFFFVCIGLGFMLVQISQMQRLSMFLGHPTHGLSVVLFSLLLAGGAGSLSTRALGADGSIRGGTRRLAALVLTLAVFGCLAPSLVRSFAAAGTPARILLAVALLLPIGFLMGTAFPIGMSAASGRHARLAPWFWGVNGAASICASVLATAIALSWGISAAFWTGCACYALALGAFFRAKRGF